MRRYTLQSAALSPLRLEYESSLNQEQREVVLAPAGPMLVLAGAGTGKTRTLTWRLARLLELGYAPREILLLTFTRRAAHEMLVRAAQLAKVDPEALWGGTFHHVGHRVLREHAEVLGFRRDFGILDREDGKELMAAAIADCGFAVGQRRFPKADVVMDLYSMTLNVQRPLGEIIARRTPHFLAHEDALAQVCRRYMERKRELNLMDYDDLLLHWRGLMVDHPGVGRQLAERFRAVLVDEYQDVNRLQADIVDQLASVHRNVLVVGDDAQSIYSFRGADVESILRFPERWPDARICRLTVNYRSSPEILRLANHSIACNRRQFPKELQPVRSPRLLPALVALADATQQAEFVAQRVLELRDENFALKDMAVLYRAHHNALEVQVELARRGIPFVVRSGVRFFEQAHVKDAVAFLRFVENPRDELAFKRLIRIFPGLGSVSAAALWDALSVAAERGRDAAAAFAQDRLDELVPPKGRRGLHAAQRLVGELLLPSLRSAPGEMLNRIVDEGSFREYLRARFPNAQAREDDLAQLATYALQYDSLGDFVAEVALAGEIRGEDVEEGVDPDEKLTLSSIHQAKGLEWRAVFVVWAAEGRFPAPPALKTPASIEEERRLFYVACTRAKDELYLLHPTFHIERDQSRTIVRPSRFITELPATPDDPLLEAWMIEAAPAGAALPGVPEHGRLPASVPADDESAGEDGPSEDVA